MSSPSDDDLALYAGAAALLGIVLWNGAELGRAIVVGAGYVANTFARGSQLSHSHLVDDVVVESPAELVAQASAAVGYDVDPDDYALARMGRSEGVDGMGARMHVVLNDLAELQRVYGTRVYSSIMALLTHSKNERADGHFSRQALGKRQATTKDPFEGDLSLAIAVRAEHARGIDPTAGATKFVDIDSFGVQEGTGTYAETLAEWTADGLEPSNVPGASSNFVVFRQT